jgi:polar amino acid transport system substrate-binding protein
MSNIAYRIARNVAYRIARNIAAAAVMAASILVPQSASAETVEAATVDWAPYYGSTLEKDGVIAALARAAFQERGYDLTVDFIPWKRAVAMTERGRYDAVLGAYYTEDRSKRFHYSEPFYDIELGLMTRNDVGVERYGTLKDLTDYTIGVSDGYSYGESFDNADFLRKQSAANQTLNVRKLFGERVDIIAMARGIFRYEVSQLRDADLEDITFIEPPLATGRLHMMFSHKLDNGEELRDEFNAGLKAIRENGTYDKIIADFGF